MPDGVLSLSVAIPEEWGTVTGLRTSFPFDEDRLSFSFEGRTATFTAKPGFGSLIPGGDIDFAALSSGAMHTAVYFNSSLHGLDDNLPIQASFATTNPGAERLHRQHHHRHDQHVRLVLVTTPRN